MMHDRSQNPLAADAGAGESDDARNVDDQLDELMNQSDEGSERRFLVNHLNNAHVETRSASDPPVFPDRGPDG
jgi:hypothetical protein